MSDSQSEFRDVIERICAGSEEAAVELINTYGQHIRRVIHTKLSPSLRTKFDSVDFVQMVWVSVVANPEKISQMREPAELIRYLVGIGINKVREECRRRFEYQRYNVNRERPLNENAESESSIERRHDTPSQIAIARERWRRMTSNQSERDRRIVELRMSGATFVEIGQTLGIHERTARQVIADLAVAST